MLAPLRGQSVLERTYRQAMQSNAAKVVIATDHAAIAQEARRLGAPVVLTDPDLLSGTDRCAAALASLPAPPPFVINVQGDEPFMNPAHINTVAALLATGAAIATLAMPIHLAEVVLNPNIVKVALASDGHALLFSRSVIPYNRATAGLPDVAAYPYLRHLGIYGFKTEVLQALVQLPPSSLELTESLEQLRWLQAGYRILVGHADEAGPGIDTPQDLEAAEAWLAKKEKLAQ